MYGKEPGANALGVAGKQNSDTGRTRMGFVLARKCWTVFFAVWVATVRFIPDCWVLTRLPTLSYGAGFEGWPIEASQQERNNMKITYSEYTARIATDPCYYGTDCTQADASRIANAIAELVQSEFPGINVAFDELIGGNNGTIGPDPSVCGDINEWISDNWTKAL